MVNFLYIIILGHKMAVLVVKREEFAGKTIAGHVHVRFEREIMRESLKPITLSISSP